MKKVLLIALIFVFLLTPFTSCVKDSNDDILVYKTSAGAKYHRVDCRYVEGKAIEITLSEAIDEGLTPCKVCHPPTKNNIT